MRRYLTTLLLTLTLCFCQVAMADAAFTKRQDVQAYIDQLVKKHHFNRNDLVALFNKVKYHPIVLQQVKQPLEANPWNTYQRLFVNEARIENGVKFWNKHAAALRKAEEKYGVPASIIVATLGVETRYGERTGDFRVLDSLSSIGFSDSPRAPFFRSELTEFLLLTREQHLDPLSITGSYAGAIGMPQFMPSSYRYYAASFNKKTKIDLMNDHDDVIASIANYYKEHGWTKNGPVAIAAKVSGNKYNQLPKPKNPKDLPTLKTLEKYGVIPARNISDLNAQVKLIELISNDNKEYWIGFHNFNVIRRYNPNDLYAMAVYQLSHYIEAARERS